MIAGIDFNSFQVDIMLLHEDTDDATHHVYPFGKKGDAFDRARNIRLALPSHSWWEDNGVIAIGIEDPRGAARNVDSILYRVQGAILACLPADLMVHPWKPQSWRSELELSTKGKEALYLFAARHWTDGPLVITQDAADAYCLAYATRQRLVIEKAA